MDNRLFNINGSGNDMLLKALELAFMQTSSFRDTTCESWWESKEHGLVLSYITGSDQNKNKLPCELTASECLPFVTKWLESDFAKTVEPSEWCGDCDHDGSNSSGWQVYVEEWGHVDSDHFAICAIKPAFMWHGK